MGDYLFRAPIDMWENAVKRETVLYGPRGEAAVVREPRPVGFRPPLPKITYPIKRETL